MMESRTIKPAVAVGLYFNCKKLKEKKEAKAVTSNSSSRRKINQRVERDMAVRSS